MIVSWDKSSGSQDLGQVPTKYCIAIKRYCVERSFFFYNEGYILTALRPAAAPARLHHNNNRKPFFFPSLTFSYSSGIYYLHFTIHQELFSSSSCTSYFFDWISDEWSFFLLSQHSSWYRAGFLYSVLFGASCYLQSRPRRGEETLVITSIGGCK